MHEVPTHPSSLVLDTAVEAAGIAIKLARRVSAPLKAIAHQVIRSASSVPANLAEGHRRSGRDRLNHWRIAYGSAKEVDCHLRLLAASGAVDCANQPSLLRNSLPTFPNKSPDHREPTLKNPAHR